jgi:hypothetical protein
MMHFEENERDPLQVEQVQATTPGILSVYRSGSITKADNRHWGREGEHSEYAHVRYSQGSARRQKWHVVVSQKGLKMQMMLLRI